MNAVLKRSAYATGLPGLMHKWVSHDTLTVPMFHRVLPAAEAGTVQGRLGWTLTEDAFTGCLEFFRRHYNAVGMDEVLDSLVRHKPLPPRALLTTFDDGWADTANCALGCLRSASMPAAVFVVAQGVGAGFLWEESFLYLWREGLIDVAACTSLWDQSGGAPAQAKFQTVEQVQRLIARLNAIPELERNAMLQKFEAWRNLQCGRLTMDQSQLEQLPRGGMQVGSHGWSHSPMELVADTRAELTKSRDVLTRLTHGDVNTLSFPHGSYTPEILRQGSAAGYRLMFTSDAWLNTPPASNDGAGSWVLGRIAIRAEDVTDHHGEFRPEQLAGWLFDRKKAETRVVPC